MASFSVVPSVGLTTTLSPYTITIKEDMEPNEIIDNIAILLGELSIYTSVSNEKPYKIRCSSFNEDKLVFHTFEVNIYKHFANDKDYFVEFKLFNGDKISWSNLLFKISKKIRVHIPTSLPSISNTNSNILEDIDSIQSLLSIKSSFEDKKKGYMMLGELINNINNYELCHYTLSILIKQNNILEYTNFKLFILSIILNICNKITFSDTQIISDILDVGMNGLNSHYHNRRIGLKIILCVKKMNITIFNKKKELIQDYIYENIENIKKTDIDAYNIISKL